MYKDLYIEAGTELENILEYFEAPENHNKKIGLKNLKLFGKTYKMRARVRWFRFLKKGRKIMIDLETKE